MARKDLVEDEDVRAARLLDAQAKAAELFEVHLTDPGRRIGGFFEELLDLGPGPAAG